MKKIIITTLMLIMTSQAYSFMNDYHFKFQASSFSKKNSPLTKRDNCYLWTRANPGVEDILVMARQDLRKLEEFHRGFNNKFFTNLNRYKLEEKIIATPSCKDGKCQIVVDARTMTEYPQDGEDMTRKGQKFLISVQLLNNTVMINSVYITNPDGSEYINCRK